jgi:hypothetical protein
MKDGNRYIVCAAITAMMAGCSSQAAPEPAASQVASITPGNGAPLVPNQPGARLASTESDPVFARAVPNAKTFRGLADSNERATLRSVALSASSAAGVSTPTRILATAAADHQAAQFAVSGSIVNDHAPVYVMQLEGGPFTARRHAPHAAPPQAQYLLVTVDAATHRITDVGYVNTKQDLTAIGTSATDITGP